MLLHRSKVFSRYTGFNVQLFQSSNLDRLSYNLARLNLSSTQKCSKRFKSDFKSVADHESVACHIDTYIFPVQLLGVCLQNMSYLQFSSELGGVRAIERACQ
jgi:hypothetical protein